MSATYTIPSLKLHSSSSSSAASSASPNRSLNPFMASAKPPTIRNSKAEGPLRRPVAPPLREPTTPPLKPDQPRLTPSPKTLSVPTSDESKPNVITVEYQRKMAKELQDYFRQKMIEEADQGPVFGFFGKNEITNGRWAMFGFAVGLLTEYATGSDLVDQLKILLSNFGIVDLD